MNDSMIKIVQEILKPVYDELVNTTLRITGSLLNNLSDKLSDNDKEEIVKGIVSKQGEAIITAIKTSIPDDFDKQLKEAFNGGK